MTILEAASVAFYDTKALVVVIILIKAHSELHLPAPLTWVLADIILPAPLTSMGI